jgi:peptide/nickel transport system substrate-binding protein
MRRRNLLAGGAALATIGTTGLARPAIAQGASAKVLKFVPQANLANPDPIWTTATVAFNHGYMVWTRSTASTMRWLPARRCARDMRCRPTS